MILEPVRVKTNGRTQCSKHAAPSSNMATPNDVAEQQCSRYVSPTGAGCAMDEKHSVPTPWARNLSLRAPNERMVLEPVKSLEYPSPSGSFDRHLPIFWAAEGRWLEASRTATAA